MADFYLVARAEADLVEIWTYIARDSVRAADGVIDRLYDRFQKLAGSPGLGSKHQVLKPDIRVFPSDSYLIFYSTRLSGIEVVRVLHGSRDWAAILRGDL